MKNPALHAIIAISTFFIASGRGKRRYLLNLSVKKKAIFGLSFFKFHFLPVGIFKVKCLKARTFISVLITKKNHLDCKFRNSQQNRLVPKKENI